MRVTKDDEAFGYLKRVIVTPAVYPRLVEFLHFDIQSTGQKSHCVNTTFWPSQPLVRFSSELIVFCAGKADESVPRNPAFVNKGPLP